MGVKSAGDRSDKRAMIAGLALPMAHDVIQ